MLVEFDSVGPFILIFLPVLFAFLLPVFHELPILRHRVQSLAPGIQVKLHDQLFLCFLICVCFVGLIFLRLLKLQEIFLYRLKFFAFIHSHQTLGGSTEAWIL
jgi:hypothetical protein